jgi:hypothetical protein
MSLIHSARMKGHEAHVYVRDVLERLPTQLANRSATCCRIAGAWRHRKLIGVKTGSANLRLTRVALFVGEFSLSLGDQVS